jgi:hypothetical protein
MRRARRGRARSAIAYVVGLSGGLVATLLLVLAIRLVPADVRSTAAAAGVIGAFVAPFIGITLAKLRRRTRRRQAALL